jgi:hypothetical protein
MDIDSADINPTDIKLTSNEGERKPPVRCYYCNNLGHIRANCHKYKAAQEDEPNTETEVQTTNQRNTGGGRTQRVLPTHHSELLMAHIRSMRMEDHDDFLDHILTQGIQNLPDCPETAICASTCIPYKKHLKPMNILSHFGRMTWNNLAKALQGHFKEHPHQQDDPTMVPNRIKWHQQTYQRLPGEEQGYSLK